MYFALAAEVKGMRLTYSFLETRFFKEGFA
jgi:hypothetical protein